MKTVIVISTCLLLASLSSQADVVIIVNQGNTSDINKTSVSQLFLGKAKTFSNGSLAVPINQIYGGNITKEFTRKALKKSPNQLKAYWSKLMFTGKGTPPQAVKNDAEVIKLISNNPNLIGYVSTSADTSTVKVVENF
jgi:ABC-type phosphate transport system substrate-binding protein